MYAYAYRYFCLLVFVRVPYLTVNDADPDPGLGAFSTPGWEKVSIRIWNPE